MDLHKKYVLASSSKSRRMVLKNCGFRFTQVNPKCDEEEIKKNIKKNTRPEQVAKILSFEKSMSISQSKKYLNYYVIGCDTVIYINKKIFDKAKNIEEAHNKIKDLSGKTHRIISGLTVCRRGEKIWQCSETTFVKIRYLKKTQIDSYLKKTGKQILGSVGCYQIESLGPNIIENIRGDYFNVLGFPLFKFLNQISKF
tara:strand:+ start:331 stop:924 length:594 start_codon:yes stop_codon:yes gene_type:complete